MKCQYNNCNSIALYPPEKGKRTKWCCSEIPASCSGIKLKNSLVHKSENISEEFINNENILCNYGCDKPAKFRLVSNKKLCCSKTPSGCTKLREVNFKIHRTTIEKLKEKHPIFYEIENPRENKDGKIEVKCKFCKKWFTPSMASIRSRICNLESDQGNKGSYLFCSDDCKYSSDFYHFNKRTNSEQLSNYKKYAKKVYYETLKTLRIHKDKIKNIELRGRKFGYQLDHKFSIYEGFIKNISPEIVGHWKNLEVITDLENIRKFTKSTITIEKLIIEIENVKKEK